ncbi:hypothetical protein VTK73DRAFT_9283 [Phialemonium thermophilum]|uniref:Uncharacterized protein n=1 Tax=Phialemonium thermophilum TaxID=223376 RepID=A0ABR3W391_9PEZI
MRRVGVTKLHYKRVRGLARITNHRTLGRRVGSAREGTRAWLTDVQCSDAEGSSRKFRGGWIGWKTSRASNGTCEYPEGRRVEGVGWGQREMRATFPVQAGCRAGEEGPCSCAPVCGRRFRVEPTTSHKEKKGCRQDRYPLGSSLAEEGSRHRDAGPSDLFPIHRVPDATGKEWKRRKERLTEQKKKEEDKEQRKKGKREIKARE